MDWRQLLDSIKKTYSVEKFLLNVEEGDVISICTQNHTLPFQIVVDINPKNVINTSLYTSDGGWMGETEFDSSLTAEDHMRWLRETLEDAF